MALNKSKMFAMNIHRSMFVIWTVNFDPCIFLFKSYEQYLRVLIFDEFFLFGLTIITRRYDVTKPPTKYYNNSRLISIRRGKQYNTVMTHWNVKFSFNDKPARLLNTIASDFNLFHFTISPLLHICVCVCNVSQTS